jgi:hypothetical protein
MAEEFYLPEEVVEWLGRKKSELLAWVLENQALDDIPVEDHHKYEGAVAQTLANPDQAWGQKWEGYRVVVQLKMFEDRGVYWMFVVALLSPVVDRPGEEVIIPVLTIPTWDRRWLLPWCQGDPRAGGPLQ